MKKMENDDDAEYYSSRVFMKMDASRVVLLM
jgi:hypothetical protein